MRFWKASWHQSMSSLPLPRAATPHKKKLRKIDFMPKIDKVSGKLLSWKGKLMSKAARAQLVKTVLTSVVTYHATILTSPSGS
jgi:hypothetical protein